MTGDDARERRGTDSEEPTRRASKASAERSMPVVGAYDAIDETAVFVVAAVDRDDAWLAVEAGGERGLEEWR